MAKEFESNWSELLSAYLDGELSERERLAVEDYLSHHPQAVVLLAELRETRRLLQELPSESAPTGFAEQVMAGVERQALLNEEPVRPSLGRRNRWSSIRAAAVLVLMISGAGGYIFWQSNQQTAIALKGGSPTQRPDSPEPRRANQEGLSIMDSVAVVGPDDVQRWKETVPSDQKLLQKYRDEKKSLNSAGRVENASTPVDAEAASVEMRSDLAEMKSDITPSGRIQHAPSPEQNLKQKPTAMKSENAPMIDRPVEFSVDFGKEQLLATQESLASQLARGAPSEELSHYDFRQEEVELTLNFSNVRDCDEYSEQARAYFASRAFKNATDPIERVQIVEPETSAIYVPGRCGVNYDNPASRQYVVKAKPEALVDLLGTYEKQTKDSAGQEAAIRIGKKRVEGMEKSLALARLLDQPEWREVLLPARKLAIAHEQSERGYSFRSADSEPEVVWGKGDDWESVAWQLNYQSQLANSEYELIQQSIADDWEAQEETKEVDLAATTRHEFERKADGALSPSGSSTTVGDATSSSAEFNRDSQQLDRQSGRKSRTVVQQDVTFLLNLQCSGPSSEDEKPPISQPVDSTSVQDEPAHPPR